MFTNTLVKSVTFIAGMVIATALSEIFANAISVDGRKITKNYRKLSKRCRNGSSKLYNGLQELRS